MAGGAKYGGDTLMKNDYCSLGGREMIINENIL